jgi:hypothetical protein
VRSLESWATAPVEEMVNGPALTAASEAAFSPSALVFFASPWAWSDVSGV